MSTRRLILRPAEVRALLESGGATVVREVEPQPEYVKRTKRHVMHSGWEWQNKLIAFPVESEFIAALAWYCPYGRPGETCQTDEGASVRIASVAVEQRDGAWCWVVACERVERAP